METGCKLGSPDKFENNSLMQSHSKMREPGIVLDSRKNMMRNLAF